MKKRFLAVLSMILCFACLFGCTPSGSGSSDKSKEESVEAEESVAQSDSEQALESASETQTEVESESESETQTETETQTESETATETESETESETERETEKPSAPIPGITSTTSTLTAATYDLSKNLLVFRYIGRSKASTSGTICDHSASGIEFQGYMTGDVSIKVSTSYDTYYTVYIDGKRVDERFYAKGSNQTIKLASFEGKYFHKIKILKQSEIGWTTSLLHSLNITGYLVKAPEERDYYIELYGDSLTSAFGNIGSTSSSSPYDEPKYQDATKSYGFLLSEMINADCSILAMSGVGLSVGYYDNPFLDYFSKYSHKRGSEEFNFKGARVPDLAIIHLGANDETCGDDPNNKRGYGESTGSFKTNFIAKAKELIAYIRDGYGKDVPIIWAYDPYEGVPNYIEEVLNSLGGEAKGLYMIELEWKGINGFEGAGNHPSYKAHEKHADLLINFIVEKNIIR